ncbi:MAG: hypothetical protein HC774_06820 [Sphingomonadales bacterium]|nr:hypothetical protein [Sphingomonadales bacterium]
MPVILGAIWAADKAYAAYEGYQDIHAIRSGEKTVAEVAQDRAVEQAAGVVAGGLGRAGVKIAKYFGRGADRAPQIGSARQTGGRSMPGGDDAAADRMYDEIRKSNADVGEIARATGLKEKNIQRVKDHVFNEEHVLDRYVKQGYSR